MKLTSLDKAQAINYDFGTPNETGQMQFGKINYRGAIAEIGAGQEVARLFFEAYSSARTIVKTMSAYGKGCSNAIYDPKSVMPKSASYVTEERLIEMFDHDYNLLLTRSLTDDEKPKDQQLRYFTFANTLAIDRDGWAGVRVQTEGCSLAPDPNHEALEYSLHFEILAKDKIAKIKIVGALGINLIYAALLHGSEKTLPDGQLVPALMENIEKSDLRIDTINVRKLAVTVENRDKIRRVKTKQIDTNGCGKLSQALCIELVKTSTVHCASFNQSKSASVISYKIIEKPTNPTGRSNPESKYLVLTRSLGSDPNLKLESQMLKVAKRAFKSELPSSVIDSDIQTAIHLPILGVLQPDKDTKEQGVYISDKEAPAAFKKHREELLQSISTAEVADRVEHIIKARHIALVSEFISSSEIIKYLRDRTRLQYSNVKYPMNVAFVFRADQLIELLINVTHQVKDRVPVEVIGSIIRRKTKLLIYPCDYSCIFNGKTRYGIPICEAFKEEELTKHDKTRHMQITIAQLKTGLIPNYSSLIEYMESASAIQDLDPGSKESRSFVRMPLPTHI